MTDRFRVPAVVLVEQIAEAIAVFEGYWKWIRVGKRSKAWRNNNPGNLRRWGSEPQVDGFAWFGSRDTGWRALRLQVWKNVVVRRLTLREFFAGKAGVYAGYAPRFENDSRRYALFVFDYLGKRGLSLDSIDAVIVGHASFEGEIRYPGLGR